MIDNLHIIVHARGKLFEKIIRYQLRPKNGNVLSDRVMLSGKNVVGPNVVMAMNLSARIVWHWTWSTFASIGEQCVYPSTSTDLNNENSRRGRIEAANCLTSLSQRADCPLFVFIPNSTWNTLLSTIACERVQMALQKSVSRLNSSANVIERRSEDNSVRRKICEPLYQSSRYSWVAWMANFVSATDSTVSLMESNWLIEHGSTPRISERTDGNIISMTGVKFLNIMCLCHITCRMNHRRFTVITTGVGTVGTLNLLVPNAANPDVSRALTDDGSSH